MNSARTFTSLALLRLDPKSGEALLSNAGHPYPMLARNGETTSELEVPSLPLGQGPPRSYEDIPLSIPNGAALVFCSDGLFEATDAYAASIGWDPQTFDYAEAMQLLDAATDGEDNGARDAASGDDERPRGFRAALAHLESKGCHEGGDEPGRSMRVNPASVTGYPQIHILDPDRNVIEINAERVD